MEIKFKNREDLENFLMDMDFDEIEQDILRSGGSSYLRDILYSGWRGMCQMTDAELIEEFNCRTEDTAVILTDDNGDAKLWIVE